MLNEIRDRSSGWFAWVIAALIIIPMAFWGDQDYASTEANPTLIEFGDTKITDSEFRARLNTEQQQMRQRMGENVNDAFLSSESFKQGVLDRMVSRAVLQQLAQDENYRISNSDLAEEIRNSELFQIDGEFNQEAYNRFLIGSQYSKTRYEDALRDDLVLAQVTQGYDESAIVLPDEVRFLLEAQSERRSFDIATLRKQSFLDAVAVSDAEIGDYYNANQARFMQPQQVSIEYLELNTQELAEEVEVDEEELLSIFEQNAESYVSAAKRETRHILLPTGGDESDEAQLTKAESLVAELRGGADFAVLAKEHSQDPGSAQIGGSLGLVERGQMVPAFEEATFALEKDQISDPVKSPFGYHIIQVQDIQVPEQQSFDDVRFDLLQTEREQRAEDILIDRVSELRDLAFEQPDNLDAAAEQLGLELRSSELFSQSAGEGIAANPIVRNAAFSEDVLIDEVNSEPIEVAPGQTIVLRKKDVKAAAPQPLADVSDQVREILKNQKAAEQALKRGEVLFASAKNSWDVVASNEELEHASHTVSLVEPNRVISPEVQQKVTSMQAIEGSAAIEMITDRSGDVHIVRLRSITPGNIAEIPEQLKEATRRVIAQRNGSALMGEYLEQLKDEQVPGLSAEIL